MPRMITNDELALIAALRPFLGPRAQQLIDTFLEIANKRIEATGQRELDTVEMLAEVTGLMRQQMESFMTLAVISGVLMLPEMIATKSQDQQDMGQAPEIDAPVEFDEGLASDEELH